jgi:chromate reductase
MAEYRIAVLVGSLRRASLNLKLAHALEKMFPPNFRLTFASLGDVPLFNQDHESDPPAAATALKQLIADSDGVLFVSPEHNRSMPAAIKNAIDWGTRPAGSNNWTGKPAGIVGTSPSAAGTAMMQQHLRLVLAAEGAVALTTPEVFLQWKEGLVDDQFVVTNEGSRKFLQGWVDRYVAWVELLAPRAT